MVVWVDLNDASPPEMGKVRPGIVVSGSGHNESLNTVVVIPTSSVAPEIWPLRLSVGKLAGKMSFAVVPGIRQVRKSRLLDVIGVLSPKQLAALDECVAAYLE